MRDKKVADHILYILGISVRDWRCLSSFQSKSEEQDRVKKAKITGPIVKCGYFEAKWKWWLVFGNFIIYFKTFLSTVKEIKVLWLK